MTITPTVGPLFRPGDEVVPVKGSNEGTLSVFQQLRQDTNWADSTGRNGKVRSHPIVWLAHVNPAR